MMAVGRLEPGTHGFSVDIIYASHCPVPSFTGINSESLILLNGSYSSYKTHCVVQNYRQDLIDFTAPRGMSMRLKGLDG